MKPDAREWKAVSSRRKYNRVRVLCQWTQTKQQEIGQELGVSWVIGQQGSNGGGRGAAGWAARPEQRWDLTVFVSCQFHVIFLNSKRAALCQNHLGLLWDKPPAARVHRGGVLEYLWISDACPLELQEAKAHSRCIKAEYPRVKHHRRLWLRQSVPAEARWLQRGMRIPEPQAKLASGHAGSGVTPHVAFGRNTTGRPWLQGFLSCGHVNILLRRHACSRLSALSLLLKSWTPLGDRNRLALFLKVLELNPVLHRCSLNKRRPVLSAEVAVVPLALDLGLKPFGRGIFTKERL